MQNPITTALGILVAIAGILHENNVYPQYTGFLAVVFTAALGYFAQDAKNDSAE